MSSTSKQCFTLILITNLALFIQLCVSFQFNFHHKKITSKILFTSTFDKENINTIEDSSRKSNYGDFDGSSWVDEWEGNKDGFDWELEKARRLIIGPAFSPIRMTPWQPTTNTNKPPGLFDHSKILLNNALQIMGLAKSIDGAPLVQGVNTFQGDPLTLLSRVIDGNLAEIAGGPLFLLLQKYYKEYGPIYKLAFGPKSFIVISDPTMVKHILKENSKAYDKGILAEILDPIMGKGLIPADPETWKIRRRAIVPGFHKAWLNAMVRISF